MTTDIGSVLVLVLGLLMLLLGMALGWYLNDVFGKRR